MVTVYVLIILWANGQPTKTHMVYGSKADCEDALAYRARIDERQIKSASCTAKTVKRGTRIPITEGLEFIPD
jgi:hypothetical protein